MSARRSLLDDIDKEILKQLASDCSRAPIGRLAKTLNIPKSTLHYRMNRLEEVGIITGYHASIDLSKLSGNHQKIITLHLTDEKKSAEKVYAILKPIIGVWGIYYHKSSHKFTIIVSGDDFLKLNEKLNRLYELNLIDQSSIEVISKIFRQDPKLFENMKTK